MRFQTAIRLIALSLFVMALFCSCGAADGYSDDLNNRDDSADQSGEGSENGDNDDTIYLYSVEELLDYKNENGQRVVIDLSGSAEHLIGKTLTIAGDVSEVVLRGSAGAVYSDMNVRVEHHDVFPIDIVFDNFKMQGNASGGTVFCSSGRAIRIVSSDGDNMILGGAGAYALNAPDSKITLDGTAPMYIAGGSGEDGVDAAGTNGISGGDGGLGACAVIAEQLDKYGSGVVRIVGGKGGKGGSGGQGSEGKPGTNGTGDIWITVVKPVKSAGKGGTGGQGGDGGNGGNGGDPLNISCIINVCEGEMVLVSGAGGNGGSGGTGGTGGIGGIGGDADKGSWMLGFGWTYGANGGQGGNGGDGGSGGDGGVSDISQLDYTKTVSEGAKFSLSASSYGVGGKGGEGGNGGSGGQGGSCDSVVVGNGCQIGGEKCTCGGKGGDGGKGGNGGQGGNGSAGGEGGAPGLGGSGGAHSESKKKCACVGASSSGSVGNIGVAGSIIEAVPPSEELPQEPEGDDSNGERYPGYGLSFPEGTTDVIKDNGTQIFFLPDNTVVFVKPDGRVFTVYPDGSWKHLNSDGSAIPNDDSWPICEYTKLIPRPDFAIKISQHGDVFSFSFTGVAPGDIREYTEMLTRLGFSVNLKENSAEEFYQYSASNAEGYMIVLLYNTGSGNLIMYK